MTLEDYRLLCGWSKNEMARMAKMDFSTLQKAMNGEVISINTANKLAHALSVELGRVVRIPDIEGLKVK